MDTQTTYWESAALTHPGQRAHNEDYFLEDTEHGIYVVADGVGGRDAGEIASRIGCETIVRQVAAGETLEAAFAAAQHAIAEAVESGEGRSGMAATAVALHVTQAAFSIAWLGDCRAYLWDGKLRLLTRDHSLVEAMLARGEINLQQAAQHPQRNVILAALGGESGGPDVGSNHGVIGGRGCFILCSDGLCDTLDNAQISEILEQQNSLAATTHALLDAAVTGGCKDNVTVLAVSFDGGPQNRGTTRYAHSVRTYDPQQGVTLDQTRPLVGNSTKVRRLGARVPATADGGDIDSAVVGPTTIAPVADSDTAGEPAMPPTRSRRTRPALIALVVLVLLLLSGIGLMLYLGPGR